MKRPKTWLRESLDLLEEASGILVDLAAISKGHHRHSEGDLLMAQAGKLALLREDLRRILQDMSA